MKTTEVIELAALLGRRGASIADMRHESAALRTAWKRLRGTIGEWGAELHDDRDEVVCRAAAELFAIDPVIRVWSVILEAGSAKHGDPDPASIARNLLAGLTRTRSAAMRWLMEDGRDNERRGLDQYRRWAERWTDAILGRLVVDFDLRNCAFDEERATDFAEAARDVGGIDAIALALTLAGLRSREPSMPAIESPRTETVIESILSALPAESLGGRDASLCESAGSVVGGGVTTAWQRQLERVHRGFDAVN